MGSLGSKRLPKKTDAKIFLERGRNGQFRFDLPKKAPVASIFIKSMRLSFVCLPIGIFGKFTSRTGDGADAYAPDTECAFLVCRTVWIK